jgi:8-oxo-dGTP pyrophosphatase MutT (NUDIX family)
MPAATLILVRERAGRIETHILLRGRGAAFMAEKYVFPGGRVDPFDEAVPFWERHSDLIPEEIERRLGGNFTHTGVLSYAITAIRETLEEAGAFFARGAALKKQETSRVCSLRLSGKLPKGWFNQEVAGGAWTLAISRLYRWAHWITPEQMTPRFDTRFFLGFMPEAQHCRPDGREIKKGLWIRPDAALKMNSTGEMPLSPPTLVTLQELLSYSTGTALKTACQHRNWGDPLLPRLVRADGGGVILEPWDKDYGRPDPVFSLNALEKAVLPAGAPFSKLWYNGTVWRPVAL